MDVFARCRADQRARLARAAGLYPFFRALESAQDPVVRVGGRDVVMLGSNNYLGLASDPRVREAACAAIARYGTGCAGSRLLNGTLDLHETLEARLAAFTGREAAVTFPTGFQVNLGVLACLLGRRDVALLDARVHACIVDGARLGFGRTWKFRHDDARDLERKLARVPEDHGRLVVVDGVFSMEGDVCDLPGVVGACRRHGARLVVDDAHGLGVFGARGRGVAEHFDLEPEVDLLVGTFSKSLASVGGFVAGEAAVVEYVKHHARPGIFSAALPPASAAAALAALGVLESEPERRKQLWENTSRFQEALAGLGFDTGRSASPVVPLVVGDDERAFRMVARLLEEGVFVNAVISPAVEPGRAMVRTSLMATHEAHHLDRALDALARVGRELGVR